MHRHHLIPKHLGGTDDEENLTPPISIALHAALHKMLWEDLGHQEDYIAWRALSGRITGEEARLAAAKVGQERSTLYKESRKFTGAFARAAATQETCSRGGKAAAPSLVEWQQGHRQAFLAQCAKNGKVSGLKHQIPHLYKGITYESKKALQLAHNMSICGFYGKLSRGEIQRLKKAQAL